MLGGSVFIKKKQKQKKCGPEWPVQKTAHGVKNGFSFFIVSNFLTKIKRRTTCFENRKILCCLIFVLFFHDLFQALAETFGRQIRLAKVGRNISKNWPPFSKLLVKLGRLGLLCNGGGSMVAVDRCLDATAPKLHSKHVLRQEKIKRKKSSGGLPR